MEAEGTNRASIWASEKELFADLELTIRVSASRGKHNADVSTELLFSSTLPETMQVGLSKSLYNGVHAGLSQSQYPIPVEGISVEVFRLDIRHPSVDTLVTEETIHQIGALFETVTASLVAALWDGMHCIR
jgi:hypothetical protein